MVPSSKKKGPILKVSYQRIHIVKIKWISRGSSKCLKITEKKSSFVSFGTFFLHIRLGGRGRRLG